MQLSPGFHTEKRAKFLNRSVEKNRERRKLLEVKGQRIVKKAKRIALNAAKEIREGDTYSTSINFETGTKHNLYVSVSKKISSGW